VKGLRTSLNGARGCPRGPHGGSVGFNQHGILLDAHDTHTHTEREREREREREEESSIML
jgi:hypothetical protein